MLRKPLLSLLLAVFLGAVFVYGLTRLFLLRYEVGDMYPPYSSLRTDPLGTKAIADALDALPSVEVQRNFKPLPKLRAPSPVTLVYTGVGHKAVWTQPELAAFDSLVVGGSRAVFTFYPMEYQPSARQEKHAADEERTKKERKAEQQRAKNKKKPAPDGKKPDDAKGREKDGGKGDDKKKDKEGARLRQEVDFVDFDTVAKRWGFAFDYLPQEKKAFDRQAALVEPGGHIEPEISWHSSLCFRDLKPQWKVLYMSGTKPVVIERPYGAGSIVLVADAYVISNEALRKERHPELLARIFSGPSPVIFDEESHDLRDDPGIASLARKYRLHGFVAGLLLLAGLFVWKNGVRFIPAYEPQFAESDIVAGKESGEGFINLLRRSIRPSALFAVCVGEWRKSFVNKPRDIARVDEILVQAQTRPSAERDPIATYKDISRALARKL